MIGYPMILSMEISIECIHFLNDQLYLMKYPYMIHKI